MTTSPYYLTSQHYKTIMRYLTSPLRRQSSRCRHQVEWIYCCYNCLFFWLALGLSLGWLRAGFRPENDFGSIWIWGCRFLALNNWFVMLWLGKNAHYRLRICSLGWFWCEKMIDLTCTVLKVKIFRKCWKSLTFYRSN